MSIETIATAIEVDGGMVLPDLQQSLQEMQAHHVERSYISEQLLWRNVRQKKVIAAAICGLYSHFYCNLAGLGVMSIQTTGHSVMPDTLNWSTF